MSSFAAWGLTILGIAVITTVAEMFLPQGKTKKVIRSVFAVVTVLAIITPLPTLLKNGFGASLGENGVEMDESYLQYVEEAKKQMLIGSVEKHLKENGHSGGYSIDLDADGWTVKSVRIKFDEPGITEKGEHINKNEIIKLVADYFDIGREAIMTYG